MERDLNLARQYLESSAHQDFADAQAALGVLLIDHFGAYDDGQAWLERAAKKVTKTPHPVC